MSSNSPTGGADMTEPASAMPDATRGTVSLADEEGVKRILVDTILGLWNIVNDLTRLRPSKRERYRVTIFGSARAEPGSFVYDEVKRVATALSQLGCDIVTGGGPGLMQAANEGAAAAGAALSSQSIGIRVDLPFEQSANPFVEQVFEHRTFFTRLHHFVLASDAFVVAPGGIGTVLETLMIWQLLQVRHLHDTPLILAGKFWDGLVEWAKTEMLRPDVKLVSPADLEIPQILADGPSIVRAIREHHARWQARQGQSPGERS